MCHVTGVKNKDSPSIITVLTEIIRSRRFSVTPTVEMRSIVEIRKHPHSGNEGFGIKNPAQGFHSIINNRVFYRRGVAVSDYNNINNKITKITDVALVLRYRCAGVAF